jgi:hypothetical protein
MIAGMTTSASTVAWIGAGGVIVGAAVSAFASWITTVVTSRHTATEARDDRRRAAYSAFLGALDEILALCLGPGDFGQQLDTDPVLAQGVRQALSSIAHTSVAVLLSGSPEAREAVQGIDHARWGVVAALIDPAQRGKLYPLMQQFVDVKTEITDLGREELAGPQPWWKIRGRRGPGIRRGQARTY